MLFSPFSLENLFVLEILLPNIKLWSTHCLGNVPGIYSVSLHKKQMGNIKRNLIETTKFWEKKSINSQNLCSDFLKFDDKVFYDYVYIYI